MAACLGHESACAQHHNQDSSPAAAVAVLSLLHSKLTAPVHRLHVGATTAASEQQAGQGCDTGGGGVQQANDDTSLTSCLWLRSVPTGGWGTLGVRGPGQQMKHLQWVMGCMALPSLLHPLLLSHHSSLASSLWHRNLQRTQMRNSTDQALMRAFREVNRIADRLNVTKAARDTAMDYYR